MPCGTTRGIGCTDTCPNVNATAANIGQTINLPSVPVVFVDVVYPAVSNQDIIGSGCAQWSRQFMPGRQRDERQTSGSVGLRHDVAKIDQRLRVYAGHDPCKLCALQFAIERCLLYTSVRTLSDGWKEGDIPCPL